MEKYLKEISKLYNIKKLEIIKEFKVKGERIVFLLRCHEGMFIVKGFNQTTIESEVKKNTESLNYVGEKGKIAPYILKSRQKELYVKIEDRFFYIMEYIDGRQALENPQDLYEIGRTAAVLHSYNDYLINSAINSENRASDMLKRFSEFPFKKEYDETIINLPNFDKLRQAFIHTDIGAHNALILDSQTVKFVDFDDSGRGSIFIDAGYPLITEFVRFQKDGELKFNYENAKAFYEGYFSLTVMNDNEKMNIFDGAVFMQLMYMPCYGEEAVMDMWDILKYSLRNKEMLCKVLL